jgi:hypothetical protein
MPLAGIYLTSFSRLSVQDEQMNISPSEDCTWLCKEHWNVRVMTRLNGEIVGYMAIRMMFRSLGRDI